jgi:hypothetical protein
MQTLGLIDTKFNKYSLAFNDVASVKTESLDVKLTMRLHVPPRTPIQCLPQNVLQKTLGRLMKLISTKRSRPILNVLSPFQLANNVFPFPINTPLCTLLEAHEKSILLYVITY